MLKKVLVSLMVILIIITGCKGSGSSYSKTGTIDSFGQSTVDVKGGDTLMVYGSGFRSDLDYSLSFGGVLATDVKVVDSSSLQVIVPKALKQGPVDVELHVGTDILSIVPNGITYDGYFPLKISKITPTQVDINGGEEITVYGEGFSKQTKIIVNDTPVESKVISSTKLTFKAPTKEKGALNISLIRAEDGAKIERDNIGTYVNKAPTIIAINPNKGFTTGGDVITIIGTNFTPNTEVFFNKIASPLVEYVSKTKLKVTSPANTEAEKVTLKVIRKTTDTDNIIVKADAKSTFEYIETPPGYKEAPYLVSARALDSTHVLLQFSEPMSEDSAKVEYYNIVGSDLVLENELSTNSGSRLVIKGAKLQNESQVVLTTLSMSEINYKVSVTGATDKSGHALRADDKFNSYNSTIFSGAGEVVAPGQKAIDTDGDGLSDADEQRGYIVQYVLTAGNIRKIAVTSDPEVRDTDGDGLDDYTEFAEGTNPRSADTDHDRLSDYQETGIYASDPRKQDTDGDGLNDVEELSHGTSILLADTDGDQFSDSFELEQGTNPRVANLPEPVISVNNVSAAIDVRFVETTTNGTHKETVKSFESTNGGGSSSSSEHGINGSIEVGGGIKNETEIGLPSKDTFTWDLSGKVSVGGFYTWKDESNEDYSYSKSLSSNFVTDKTKEITRTVEGARVSVAVSFTSQGDVAFTLKDIELSLLMRDPENPTAYKSVATLLPSNNTLEINIGPLTGTRGPILFHAKAPIPSEVEQFMKNPSLFVVKIANYNMVDENGRNFAYASQDIVNRTAGFNIIYNDGVTKNKTYRIATTGKFDLVSVKPVGVTLKEALKSVRLYAVDDQGTSVADLELTTHQHPGSDGVTVSGEYYVNHTFSITNGQITRVKGVQISYKNGKSEGYDSWVLLDQYGHKVDATSLDSTYLEKKGNYTLIYTKDIDGDGLSEAQEKILGTKDTLCDSDGDGLSDYREIYGLAIPYLTTAKTDARAKAGHLCPNDDNRTRLLDDNETYAWRLATYANMDDGKAKIRMRYFRAYSNPLKEDSDGDRLSDYDEFKLQMPAAQTGENIPIWRADALVTDTDDDGLNDYDEINGYTYNSIVDDSLHSIQAEGVRAPNTGPFINIKDSDNDGIVDGLERIFGSNPLIPDKNLVQDTNKDGLPNKYAEGEKIDNSHFKFKTACPGVEYDMTYAQQQKLIGNGKSTVDQGDVDGDGLPNVWEYFLCTNPFSDDTDEDTLKDNEEWDYKAKPSDVVNDVSVITPGRYAAAKGACDYALNCQNPIAGKTIYNTNPLKKDTDSDGLSDLQEIQGWKVWLEDVDNSGNRVAPFMVYSNPRMKDSDGDGLTDLQEYDLKTNPSLVDTDGDGKNDWDENNDTLRNPLSKDTIYELRLISLNIIDNSDDGINTNNLYDKLNASGLHFSNIRLLSASGTFVGDSTHIIDRNTIFDEMMATPKPDGYDRGLGLAVYSSWGTYEDRKTCIGGTYKKAPIYDNDFFNFNKSKSQKIAIGSNDAHYLSFSMNLEMNIDDGCDGINLPATDRFMVYDGTLQSKAKITAKDLLTNGYVMLKFTQDDFDIRSDGTDANGKVPKDHLPIFNVVFMAKVVD